MTFAIGDVVMLKSGGQALTVAAIDSDEVTCIWIGEEGDFFREKMPAATLVALEDDQEADEEEEEEEEEDEDEDEAAKV